MGQGVEELTERLRGRVSVLYGPSGAGKSSLLNAIQPDLDIKEGRISSYWKQGKHTTTYSAMHALALGGYVIDTPGIRVFRPYGLRRTQVRDLFPDLAAYQGACQYSNCTHDHEPGCAVADAVAARRSHSTRSRSRRSAVGLAATASATAPQISSAMSRHMRSTARSVASTGVRTRICDTSVPLPS